MKALSHRALASFAVSNVANGVSWKVVSRQLAAELVASKRTKEIDQVVSEIASELEKQQLLITARVTTARPLTIPLRNKIISFVKQASDTKEVVLEPVTDISMVSGLKIETPSQTWDLTGKAMLRSLTSGGTT